MKLADIFWCKVGFGVIGFIAGSIWCLIFYPLFKIAQPELALLLFYKVFVSIFVLASVVSEKFIGHAGFGALYAIYGYLTVLVGVETAPVDWSKTAIEVLTCLAIGVIAGILTLVWGQYAL